MKMIPFFSDEITLWTDTAGGMPCEEGIDMTRKDYVAIAAAIRAARRDVTNREPPECVADMQDGISLAAEHLADALRRDNPRFDRARFLAACGDPET